MIDSAVKKCLATLYETTEENISQVLKNEKATTYLIVWSEYEQRLFGGYLKKEDLKDKADSVALQYDILDVDEIAEKFHLRFQDKKRYRNLVHKEKPTDIRAILDKKFEVLSYNERLYLLLYVTYRYRNNIFHGNKGVLSWTRYTEQINDCITFMVRMITLHISNKQNDNNS